MASCVRTARRPRPRHGPKTMAIPTTRTAAKAQATIANRPSPRKIPVAARRSQPDARCRAGRPTSVDHLASASSIHIP